jgi:hypothetical protein
VKPQFLDANIAAYQAGRRAANATDSTHQMAVTA